MESVLHRKLFKGAKHILIFKGGGGGGISIGSPSKKNPESGQKYLLLDCNFQALRGLLSFRSLNYFELRTSVLVFCCYFCRS